MDTMSRTLCASMLLHASLMFGAEPPSSRPDVGKAVGANQGVQSPRMKAKFSAPSELSADDGRVIRYSPTSGPNDLSLADFGGFFVGASCPDVTGQCSNGGGPLTEGLHLPSTTAGFGGGIHLDGVAKQISVQLSYGFDTTTFYLDAPDSPIVDQQNPYPWCPLPQPPDYRQWYVELDGVLRQTYYYCWQAPADLDITWSYPWSGPSTMYWHASYEGGTLQDTQFVLDPINLLMVSGDGQTIPTGEKTLQPLVVELKTGAGTPVNFPISAYTKPPSATITGPSRSAPKIVSIDFLGGNKFGITAQVDTKVGTYTVGVKHQDADPNSPLTFTINAVAKVPPTDNPQDEQNNGNQGSDPSQQGQQDLSGTQQAKQQNQKLVKVGGCPPRYELVADPVNVTNGSSLRMEVDYAQTGLSPIEFVRTYNGKGSVSPMMGNYWTTTYDRAVLPAVDGQPLRLRRPDGLLIRYSQVGSTYVSDAFFHGTLAQNGTGWRYTDTDQTVEDYDSSGRLIKTTGLKGRTQTLTYSKGRLTKVTANTGEYLTFAYTNSQLASMSDQAGRTWTYVYDNYRNLTAIKQPNTIYRNYFYSDQHNPWLLTGVAHSYSEQTDASRIENAWEYDAQGHVTASWFNDVAKGQLHRTDITYDSDGTTRGVMDGNGNTGTYSIQTINGRGFVSAIAGPGVATCGNDLTRQFDGAMNVLSKTQAGHVTTFGGYDAKGQHANRVVAAGTSEAKSVDYLYDARYLEKPTQIMEPSVVAGRSKVTTIDYDAFGNVIRRTESGFRPNSDPQQAPTAITRTWNYQYNGPYHQLSSIDGPRTDVSDVTTFEYDPNGRLRRVTDANGIIVRDNITYTPTGNVASEDRSNGLHIAYSYEAGPDLLHSITETQGSSARATTWSHDIKDRVTEISFSDGVNPTQSVNFDYNGAGEISYVASQAGVIKYTFDDQGNPTRDSYETGSGAELSYIQRTFDAYNRVDKVIGANNTIDYDFDPDGTLTQSRDGKQQLTKRFYDGLKRLARVVRPDTSQIQYLYDSGGNLDQVIDPNQGTTTYLYDDFHQKVAQISPDTGTSQYSYNLAGDLVQAMDANGHATNYTYDAGDRVLTVDRDGTDYDETYTYDNCINGVGHRCSVSNGLGEMVSYEYDGFGEISKVTTANALVGSSVSYQYDAQGHVAHVTYPSGRMVNYTFNAGGQVTAVSVTESGNTSTLVSGVTYKPFGPATGWTYGNGLVHTRQYDQQNWTRAITTPNVSSLGYPLYDLNGNVQTMTVDGTGDHFTYDTFGQLQTGSGDFGTREYYYDAVGNRTRSVIDGLDGTYSYTAFSNRITGQTGWDYTLDADGNTVKKLSTDGSGSGYQYQYSSHNRLTAVYDLLVPSVPKATYVYNALGQRSAKTAGGVTTRYVYGVDGKLLAETDSVGNLLQEYVYLNGSLVSLLGPAEPSTVASYDATIDTTGVTTADWSVKSDSLANGGSYYYLSLSKAVPASIAYWDFPLPYPGNYDVYVHWLGSGEATQKYVVVGTTVSTVGIESATVTKESWVKLGNYSFPAGTYSQVQLDSSWNVAAHGAYLTADAARMVLTSASASAPANPNYEYVHTDHLGVPRAITDVSQTVVWKAAYDPFGKAMVNDDVADTGAHVTLNARFPGQYFDAESGLHYNYFRDYDPSTGRYLESDPIGLAGGLNTFAYVSEKPLRHTDKVGLNEGEADPSEEEAEREEWRELLDPSLVPDTSTLPAGDQDVERAEVACGTQSWAAARRAYWINRLRNAEPGEFSHDNLQRMLKGLAPLHEELDVSMELHHIKAQRDGGTHDATNLLEVWPWEHAAIDPYRYYNGPKPDDEGSQ